MRQKLYLAAGLCAGLLLLVTAMTATEPATELDSTSNVLVPSLQEVWICHHPPGKNGRGASRAANGKVVVDYVSICDFSDYCLDLDTDDDRSEAASLRGDAALEEAAPVPGTNGCVVCPASEAAYYAEIDGHVENHPGDCFSNFYVTAEDCGDLEPNGGEMKYCVPD